MSTAPGITAGPSGRALLRLLIALFLLSLVWQSPHLYRALTADHRPPAVALRYRKAALDNDVAAISRAAPRVTARQALRWFTSSAWLDLHGGGPFWRPLISVLWWAQYRLFGRDLVLYNLISVLLVAGAASLLAVAVAALARSLLAGVATAAFLLWKVTGPLAAVLVWFPAQTDLLAGAWLAAALLLLVLATRSPHPRSPWLLAASLLAYLCAVASKEAALAFPLVAIVMLALYHHPRAHLWSAAYLGCGLALLAVRTLTLGGAGHFLVLAGPQHLLHRALFALAGRWLGLEIIGWQALASTLLAAAILLVLTRPHLLSRRPIFYGLLFGLPALLALLATLTLGRPEVLLLPQPWRPLPAAIIFLLGGWLLATRCPHSATVLLAFLLAANLQLFLVRDWFRPHYFYLPALAWAALDGLALATATRLLFRPR